MRVNTPTVGVAALALFTLLPPHFAGGEEIYRESRSVSCLPGGTGCATFQGYIYVRRDGVAAPARSAARVGDSQLGERRLYLHLGAD